MHIRARYETRGTHVYIRVFVGEALGLTLANAGTLSLRQEELADFRQRTPDWEWIDDNDERIMRDVTYTLGLRSY